MNDLYDQIRPAEEVLDAVTAARIWARVTGEALEPTVAEPPEAPLVSMLELTVPVEGFHRRRRFAGWAAAAAVIVGFAGTAAVMATRSETIAPADSSISPDPAPSPDPSPTSPSDPEPVVTSGVADVDQVSAPDLSSGTSFAIADVVPDGWSVEAMRAESAGSLFGEAQWAQVGPDGSVTGVISVRPPILLTPEEIAQTADELEGTVRDVAADEWQDSPNNGAAIQRNGIYWIEESLQMQVSATGTAADLVRPVAEALLLDAEARSVTLPDEFGLITAADLDFADDNAVRTTLLMQPEWSDARGIVISAWPNTFGYDLDRLVGTTQDWQPIQINDTSAVGARTADGDLVALAWLDGDMFVTLNNSLISTDEEIFAVARGLRFAEANEFQAIGQSIADRVNGEITGWDVFDQIVTGDGVEISIRTEPDGAGANAVCVDAPVVDCALVQSEGGIVDGLESYGAAGFDLGDRRIGIGWVSSEIDAATIEPTLHASNTLEPGELALDETTSIVVADITTEVGRFVLVDLPEDERPPAIRFESGDQLGPRIDLTPKLDGPFDF